MGMDSISLHGVIRNGRVQVDQPIDLPDGSAVLIVPVHATHLNEDRAMNADEIALALAAVDKVEPFEMTEEDRVSATAWEKTVNDYTIANNDRGIEDVFR